VWRGHGQEAQRGQPGEHRITRNCEAIGSFLLCVRSPGFLIAVGCLIGAPHWGRSWSPGLMIPHVRDGLSMRRIAVLWTFRKPSLCRSVPREFLRNEWLDVTLSYLQLLATKEMTSRHTGGLKVYPERTFVSHLCVQQCGNCPRIADAL
jgi:hypothetical protein